MGSEGRNKEAIRLNQFRPYLLAVAQKKIAPQMQAKLAASDIVQQTLLEAVTCIEKMQELTDEHLKRWLLRILTNNLKDAQRKHRTHKRNIGLEIEQGKSKLLRQVEVAAQHDPLNVSLQREHMQKLEATINTLAQHYQEIIRRRHREGQSFTQIAAELNLTTNGAQELWARALAALKRKMERSE